MLSESDINNALTADGIIPDVLPAGTNVQRNLKVAFHTATLAKPGQMIDSDETQLKPTVFVEPPPEEDIGGLYTLIMVDPDLTVRRDTRFGQVRHWLISRCSISAAGEVLDFSGKTHSPWIGPAPIPIFDITGKPRPSRYTFILCKSKMLLPMGDDLEVPDDIHISQSDQYVGQTTDLGKPTQDLFDRWEFNTQQFIEENHLEVVAATYMLVEGNLKSGVANVGLLANAIGHKVGEIGH